MKEIEQWQLYSAGLDKIYQDLHELLTLLVEYPKYPDDVPRSVHHFESVIRWSIIPRYESKGELSKSAKAHAERIYEYLTFLSIWNEDREQLWEEIIENKIKEDN